MTVIEAQAKPPGEDSSESAQRRRRVGWVALIFGLSAGAGFIFAPGDSAWPAACLRIGIVFGALWLCLPVRKRPAVWNQLSAGRLLALAVGAILVNRLKYVFPVIGILTVLIWILKPRLGRKTKP